MSDWELDSTRPAILAAACRPATVIKWLFDNAHADSVASSGADYQYPRTLLKAWYCATNPNETTGLGSFYVDSITSSHEVTCVVNGCSGENVFTGTLPDGRRQGV